MIQRLNPSLAFSYCATLTSDSGLDLEYSPVNRVFVIFGTLDIIIVNTSWEEEEHDMKIPLFFFLVFEALISGCSNFKLNSGQKSNQF